MLQETPLYLRLNPADDVVIACRELEAGTNLLKEGVIVAERIPAGHKVATKAIAKDEPVHRYNQVIGFATRPIAAGAHVHVHNLEVRDFARDYAFGEAYQPTQFASPQATFQGIVRADGRVATRNYIGILSTVNCSATVAKYVAEQFRGDALEAFPNVDGVVPLVHTTGCGMGSTGEGIDILRRTLAGYARHANFAGVLIIGLGCEANQMDALVFTQGLQEGPVLSTMTIQDSGGTAILSETPEIYGAEHLLTRRAVSKAVGEKIVERIHWWEEYTAREKGEMNNNPSPGNKAGGLTTILEKSLGAVAKGGTTGLMGVFEYAKPVTAKGFVFMDTPGYDPVSATGQVAGGANLICFTTGRGSVYGCKPSPSLKLATNTPMFQRMSDDMDINCGEILDGSLSVQEAGARIFQLMLETASGKPSKSEMHGFGADEFVPWQLGAVM